MEEKYSKSERLKNAFCFIPFFAIFLYFVQKDKSKAVEQNAKYALLLLGGYIILNIVLGLFSSTLAWLLSLWYIGFSAYLGYTAYTGKDIKIEVLDTVFETIQKNINKKLKK